jgi:hypothetical protein
VILGGLKQAEMDKRRIPKLKVAGSNPVSRSNKNKNGQVFGPGLFVCCNFNVVTQTAFLLANVGTRHLPTPRSMLDNSSHYLPPII